MFVFRGVKNRARRIRQAGFARMANHRLSARGRVSCMQRTPAQGRVGWTAARHDAEALRQKRRKCFPQHCAAPSMLPARRMRRAPCGRSSPLHASCTAALKTNQTPKRGEKQIGRGSRIRSCSRFDRHARTKAVLAPRRAEETNRTDAQ
jgi:hypothetical protein